jgi:hypothetical protein
MQTTPSELVEYIPSYETCQINRSVPDREYDILLGFFCLDFADDDVSHFYCNAGIVRQPSANLLVEKLHSAGMQFCKEGFDAGNAFRPAHLFAGIFDNVAFLGLGRGGRCR